MSSSTDTTRRGRRGVFIGSAVVIVLLVASYVAGYFLTGDRVPNGTTVSGVDIGGLSQTEAEARLTDELADAAAAPITLTYENHSFELDPAEVGLAFDVEATVLNAGGGHSWNPVRMLDLLAGDSGDIDPVVEVDQGSLEAAITDVARAVNTAPTEPSISYTKTGKLKVTEPEDGVDVDEQATADAVVAAYLSDEETLELPVQTVEADVTADELQTMIDKVAEPAVSGSITLKLPGPDAKLEVKQYAPALSVAIDNGRLVPSIDASRLQPEITDLVDEVGAEPKDATVVLRNNVPVVIPGQPGVTLDAEEVADAILPVLTQTGSARSAEVGTATAHPDFTTADARALKIKERVSHFVTYFPYAEYRNTNQGRAAELISGTVLKPGDTFSFNDTVGERTAANGFVPGFVIQNGIFAEELGGGVSQVVTTTYNAAFFAGLKDIEHKPHSFYIDRYPLGREATVAWPTVDLKFQNDTPYGILINAWVVPSTTVSQGEMHVEMYSTKYWDIEAGVSERYNYRSPSTRYLTTGECVPTTGYGGFDVDVYRYFYRPGSSKQVKQETTHVSYIAADTVICGSPSDTGGGGN